MIDGYRGQQIKSLRDVILMITNPVFGIFICSYDSFISHQLGFYQESWENHTQGIEGCHCRRVQI